MDSGYAFTVIAGHRCELAAPGDYLLMPLYGTETELVVMNVGGEFRAFDNVCRHRGARIYTQQRGNGEPRCAYHGRLAEADDAISVALCGGFIVVTMPVGCPPAPLHDELREMMEGAPALKLRCAMYGTMDCDWSVAVENALDFGHVSTVHPSSFAKLGLTPEVALIHPYGSSTELFKSSMLSRATVAPDWLPKDVPGPFGLPFDYAHSFLFPHCCLSSTRGWTYSLQGYFPRPDGRTEFTHRLYAAACEDTEQSRFFFTSIANMNEQTFTEDADICARVHRAYGGELGKDDWRIAHFRTALDELAPYEGSANEGSANEGSSL